MKVALVDNGSLEPAAHAGLRSVADAIGKAAGIFVEAVSWKHSGRIPANALEDGPAWTIEPWIRARLADGEREFVFVPFFISPQGAIGSSLRGDLEALRGNPGGFDFSFTAGLTADKGLRRPAVVVVDHGGPSAASAAIRDTVAEAARERLGNAFGPLAAASMESPAGAEFAFNRPLLPEALAAPGFSSGDVIVAPLFLSPGRHAGPGGDLARIAREAQARSPSLRCHFTGLVGTHPIAAEFLSGALREALGVEVHP